MRATAADFGLLPCQVCGLLSRPVRGSEQHCSRCAARIHTRKPDSVARCWALLIAGYILYLPANLLPILETTTFTGTKQSTIMGGIITLWNSGYWGIAAIVFIASMVVPLFKLIALSMLQFTALRRTAWRPQNRTRVYRLVRLVGHWSMLDIYVVALLAKLVQFRFLATMEVGPAALYFGAVVVLTMFAASEFDPRLIWDPPAEERNVNE